MSCEVVGSVALARATMHCREGRELSSAEAEELVASLADEGVGDKEKAEFLLAWAEKGETGAELAGMARAFLGRAKPAGLTGRWGGEGAGVVGRSIICGPPEGGSHEGSQDHCAACRAVPGIAERGKGGS